MTDRRGDGRVARICVSARAAQRTGKGRTVLLPLPACGERVGVRGISARLRIAAPPPHPDCFAI